MEFADLGAFLDNQVLHTFINGQIQNSIGQLVFGAINQP